jgi:hypothetical protein
MIGCFNLRWNPYLTGLSLFTAHIMNRKTVFNTLEKAATENISETPGNIFNVHESGIQINTNLTQ